MRALAKELLAGARDRRRELIRLVLSLTAIDAPSGSGHDAMAACAAALAHELDKFGGRLSVSPGPQGDLLELELGRRSGPPVVLLGHYDTVWPAGTAARRPPQVDGDIIRGPGVFDMRGGIAAAIVALRLIGEGSLPLRTILLLTPDEETGSATSEQRVRSLAHVARWTLVLEPPLPGGALKTARSGWAVYRLEAIGRAAHAALAPEKGINAIDELCDALVSLRGVARGEPGKMVNIGVMSGGTSVNTVPVHAEALLDVRARSRAEQDRVEQELYALRPHRKGASLKVERLHMRLAMERSPAVVAAFEHARTAADMLGIPLREGTTSGTSDANLFAHRGVMVLDGLGPDGGGAHAEDEHVFVDSLVERSALLALLLAWPPQL